MIRKHMLELLEKTPEYDFIVIGGGASGLGVAVDAVSRGYKTALFEGIDFAKGTSSRSTKLVHGGVRYLAQGNIRLVIEALRERGLIRKNAPHLFRNLEFVIPNYDWWGGIYYGIGLKVYDLLSGRLSLGKSNLVSRKKVKEKIITLNHDALKSGVIYKDGQFDDSRLAINLAQTIADLEGTVINHMKVVDFLKDETGLIRGVIARDEETGEEIKVYSKIVINATGVFANKILKLNGRKKHALKVVPSQGIHLVLDQEFLPGDQALMIPKTSDGRVLFAIPWHGKVVVGTTDTPIDKPSYEPVALDDEVEFVLNTASNYLTKTPERKDVRSVFAGLRPLVAPEGDKLNTKEISRGHQVLVSETGLISILGGKWTTYRQMAEEVVNTALKESNLPFKDCITRTLPIHGFSTNPDNGVYSIYGSDAEKLQALIESNDALSEPVHPDYPFTRAQVVWAVRAEMARTVEDVLARRVRLLFLDAKAASESAEIVANLMAEELGYDSSWKNEQLTAFRSLARQYLLK